MRLAALMLLLGCSSSERPFLRVDHDYDSWNGLGIPVTGPLSTRGAFTSPTKHYADMTGTAQVFCDACDLGDNKTMLRFGPDSYLGSGMVIPQIPLGKIDGTLKVTSGNGVLDLHLGSADRVELTANGTVRFADPLEKSAVDVHLTFRASESLDPQALAVVTMTGALPDHGWFHVHLIGTLDDLQRRAEL